MRRSGFTTIELMLVVVIMGVIAVLGFPTIRNAIEKQNFRSARLAIGTWVGTARNTAVARGCRTTINFVSGPNSRVWVTTCKPRLGAAGLDTIVGPEFTEVRWNVRIVSGKDVITFEPRGMRTNWIRTVILLKTKQDVLRDSVIINHLGKVTRQ